MRSITATLGSAVVLAIASAGAPAAPIDAHLSHRAQATTYAAHAITFTNPLGRSRGPGAGAGQL